MEKEMKEKIIRQLQVKSRKLVGAGDIGGNKSGLYGNGKDVLGIAKKGLQGDITNIKGDISEITGDISLLVGCTDGIEGVASRIIEILEKAGKSIKQRV